MAVSANVHHVADLSAAARLISAFQNGALWRVDPNLPAGAPLENRGAALVVPGSPPQRDAPTPQQAKNLEQRSEKPLLNQFKSRARNTPFRLFTSPQTSSSDLWLGYTLAIRGRRSPPSGAKSEFDFGAGAGTRTPDPRFKRPLLYQAELRRLLTILN